ncbi:transposable element Tcb2 transposase [Trichonephila clavipes]|nr:transposable element Tcb2 transposase [Trichonephila clavipes]
MIYRSFCFGASRQRPGAPLHGRGERAELSEFERGLIIGIKIAGWSTRRDAGQVDRSECAVRNCWEQWTPEGTHARKTGSGATRKTTRREDRRIVRQALVDATVTRSTVRADVGVAISPQTIFRHLAEANLKSKRPFRALPLTPELRQLCVQCCQPRSMWDVTVWQNVVFSDESRFVLETDDNRVRVWRHPDFSMASPLPHLSPVKHVWDQLKRQMPSCHFVHDLELAVQDLWAHLPQDIIRKKRGKTGEREEREKSKKERIEETEKEREGDGKERKKSRRERERSPPCMEKRAES